jgi:hypothetical protein
MNPGRNDPCPCGSGKKYKHRCLRNESAAVETGQVFLRRRVRAAIDDLAAQLLRFVRNQLGERLIDEAWAEFTGTEDAFDPKTQHLPVFMLAAMNPMGIQGASSTGVFGMAIGPLLQLPGQQWTLSNNAKRKGWVIRIAQLGGLPKARTRLH